MLLCVVGGVCISVGVAIDGDYAGAGVVCAAAHDGVCVGGAVVVAVVGVD